MKIGFLLGSPEISGGTNVIFEHCWGVMNCGHQVSIITQQAVDPIRYEWHRFAKKLHWQVMDEAENEEFDCIVATWWESPFLLQKLKSRHYAYFVQSIESKLFAPDDPENLDLRDHSLGAARCENSYFFSIPIITEASWIRDYLNVHYNHQPYLVRNGIRKEIYQDHQVVAKRQHGRLRILVEGPVDVFHKNVPQTIHICQQADVDELWLLTSSEISSYPGVDRVFSQIPLEQTPPIYRSCDVLVKLSFVEGMFGPPLEMFHCGGTAIVYDVTGYDEYIKPGVNALVAKTHDENAVVKFLIELKENPQKLEELSREAQLTADEWPDWSRASAEFAAALERISLGPEINVSYLSKISDHFVHHQELSSVARELSRFQDREEVGSSSGIDEFNFFQAYIIEDNSIKSSAWKRYTCGVLTTVTCQLNVADERTVLRVDPSTRLGVIALYEIKIVDNQENVIEVFHPNMGFDKLYVTGTAQWMLKGRSRWLIESYGNDPQIILPRLELKNTSEITISVTMMENSFHHYLLLGAQQLENVSRLERIKSKFSDLKRRFVK